MVKHYLLLYFATLIVMALLDITWIGAVANQFYKHRIINLEIHVVPAVVFYVLYVIGVVIFVHGNAHGVWQSMMLYGALFGFFAYATYDLTNLATLHGWSVELAVVDIAWGTLLTAIASTAGGIIAKFFE